MILEKYSEDKDNSKRVKVSMFEENDSIVISAVDDRGSALPDGNLLTITSFGKVFFHHGINKELGFPLGEKGELIIASDIARQRKATYRLVEEKYEN